MQYMHIWIDLFTLHVAHMYHSYMQIHANLALNNQHMHFLRTSLDCMYLHVFACIFASILYVSLFYLHVYVCMSAACVLHVKN